MPNCLGIYTENNIIKYAKLDSDKNGTSFKLASYGVRFSENTQETIEEIIGETNSANDELATSITSEKYELIDVFSRLNKKDIKELVITGFADACASKGLIPSVMEMKFKLSKNSSFMYISKTSPSFRTSDSEARFPLILMRFFLILLYIIALFI